MTYAVLQKAMAYQRFKDFEFLWYIATKVNPLMHNDPKWPDTL